MADYNGEELAEEEVKALEELEELIREEIPLVEEIEDRTFGYTTKEGEITGISLFNKWLKKIPESVIKLTSLKQLNLSSNSAETFPESIFVINV